MGGAVATLLLAQVAVATAAVLARYGMDAGLSPTALSAWRLTLASLLVLAALRAPSLRSPTAPLPPRTRARLLAAGFLLALHFVTWFASLRCVPVARSTLLVATGPLWAGLLEACLPGRRPPSAFWLGLAVALPGALLVTGAGGAARSSLLGPAWLGDLLAVAGAMCIAAYLLLTRGAQTTLGTGRTVAWTYTAAAVALWPAVLLTEPTSTIAPRGTVAWAAVVGMALLPQLVGHTLMNLSLRRFSASAVAAATLLEPAFAAALAWPLFGERVTAVQGVGAVVLLCGVALSLRRPSPRAAVAEPAGDVV